MKRYAWTLLLLPLALFGLWETRPDLAMAGLHLFTGAPSHIPRSVGRVKAREWNAAWTPGEVESLAARSSPLRPLFFPDLSGYDLPHRLNLAPTDVVADIGCGTGAFEVGLLESGLPFQHLYAIDIDGASLEILRRLLPRLPDSGRVTPLLVEPGSLGVPDGSIDVMLVDTVQLHQPFSETDPWALHPEGIDPEVLTMLGTLKKALKAGGRLHVVENLPANMVPEPSADAIRLPYEQAGFQFVSVERLRDNPTNSGAWYLQFRRP